MLDRLIIIGGGVLAVVAYLKIKEAKGALLDAREFVVKKINPVDKQNLVNQTATKIIGKDNLAWYGDNYFSAIDWVAEKIGFENGIDGVKGQPIWKQKEAARKAGNNATKKTGANSNG